MRIAGNYTFEATREEVWAVLNDPELLARTIPGCQRLEAVGEHEYESTLTVDIQAVHGVYTARVRRDQIVALESYEIHVDGRGSNGFVIGAGSIKLRTDGAQTILDYGGEAQIGGTIATVGQRLLDGAARTLINQSLKALAQQLEERRLGVSPRTAEDQATRAYGVAQCADETTPAADGTARRAITFAPMQGLTKAALVRGAINAFMHQRLWLPWIIVAFLLGYLFGRRR